MKKKMDDNCKETGREKSQASEYVSHSLEKIYYVQKLGRIGLNENKLKPRLSAH